MKEKFCPKCGKKTEDLTESLCRECFSDRKDLIEVPDRLEICVCEACGKKKTKRWEDITVERAIKKELMKHLRSDEVEDIEVLHKENNTAEVDISITTKDIDVNQRKTVEIDLDKGLCGDCKKLSTGYFEAKVQIRTEGTCLDDVLESCQKILSRSTYRNVVSNFKRTKNGADLFMVSGSSAKYLTRKLMEIYNAERKDSKTLKGLDDGNKTYRSTYLVKIKCDDKLQ